MIYLVNLCGLPGSGKTYIIKLYQKYINDKHNEINTYLLCFDEIENNYQKNNWDINIWHESRKKCFEYIENIINSIINKIELNWLNEINGIYYFKSNISDNHIIFIDDNMYLHSMRKEVFNIAKKCI